MLVNDVIDLANDQLPVRTDTDVEFDNTEDKWTFARLAGGAIEPDRSLAEAGVYDGELLVIREAGAPASSVLVDDVEGRVESVGTHAELVRRARFGWQRGSCSVITLSTATALLLLLPERTTTPVVARCSDRQHRGSGRRNRLRRRSVRAAVPIRRSAQIGVARRGRAAVALRRIACTCVPDGHGITALPMALAVTALVALLQLMISGRGRPLSTPRSSRLQCSAPPPLWRQLLLNPNPRAVGALLATAAVIVVYLAPRATILLSRLPVPPVPTAGEPLDDIETQGGTAVEGVNARWQAGHPHRGGYDRPGSAGQGIPDRDRRRGGRSRRRRVLLRS